MPRKLCKNPIVLKKIKIEEHPTAVVKTEQFQAIYREIEYSIFLEYSADNEVQKTKIYVHNKNTVGRPWRILRDEKMSDLLTQAAKNYKMRAGAK